MAELQHNLAPKLQNTAGVSGVGGAAIDGRSSVDGGVLLPNQISGKLAGGQLFIGVERHDDRARAVKLYHQQMVNLHRVGGQHSRNDISVSKRAEIIIKLQELEEGRTQRFTIGFLQSAAFHYLERQLGFEDADIFRDAMLFEINENDYKNLHVIISPFLMAKEIKDLDRLVNDLAVVERGVADEMVVEKIARIGCEVAALIENVMHRLPNKTLALIQQWEDEMDSQTFSSEPQMVEMAIKKYIPNEQLQEFNQLVQQINGAVAEKNLTRHDEVAQKLWVIIKQATQNLPITEQLVIEHSFNTKPAVHQTIGTAGGWGLIRHLVSYSMKDPFVE